MIIPRNFRVKTGLAIVVIDLRSKLRGVFMSPKLRNIALGLYRKVPWMHFVSRMLKIHVSDQVFAMV